MREVFVRATACVFILAAVCACVPESLDRPMRRPPADAGVEDMPTTQPEMGTPDMTVTPPDMMMPDVTPPGPENVFEEQGGLVAVEAEDFITNDDKGAPRAWYLTDGSTTPDVTPDPDGAHLAGASGGGYLEGLPDTKVTVDDPSTEGQSIYDMAGTGPTLTYKVFFNTTGTYYVHVRGYAMGGEDNSVHVGVDGNFNMQGYRLQWCDADYGSWAWSNTRDCGMAAPASVEISTAGMHDVQIAMREDGAEIDKLLLTTDAGYNAQGAGPDPRPYQP